MKVVFVKVNFGSLGETIPVYTNEPPPAMLTAIILPVLFEDLSMPSFQVQLHLFLSQARCTTEEAACIELTRAAAAGVSMTREVGGRHHSSSCSSGEEVGHPVLCGEVQLHRRKVRKELVRFACQAFEVAWIFHSHLELGTMNNVKESSRNTS